MSTVLSHWRRLPVVVRAVLTGLAMAAAGTASRTVMNTRNLKIFIGRSGGRHQPRQLYARAIVKKGKRIANRTRSGWFESE